MRHRIALGRFRARVKTELRRKNIKYPDGGGIFTGKGKKRLRSLKNLIAKIFHRTKQQTLNKKSF